MNHLNVFIRPCPARLNDIESFLAFCRNKYIGFSTLFKSKVDAKSSEALLESFVHDNFYIKDSEHKKARYGEKFEFYLPNHLMNENQLKDVIHDLIYELLNGYQNQVPYIVFYKKMKERYLVKIWIADRTWIREVKTHRRTLYKTPGGKFVKEGTAGAIRFCSAGDPRKDKDGNDLVVMGWSQDKTELFRPRYHSKKISDLRDLIYALYLKIRSLPSKNPLMFFKGYLRKVSPGKFVKAVGRFRVNQKHDEHRQHLYRELAMLQLYIAEVSHDALKRTYDYKKWERENIQNREFRRFNLMKPNSSKSKSIYELFRKYRARFEKGSYHDELGHHYSLTQSSNLDYIANLKRLRAMFKADINNILEEEHY